MIERSRAPDITQRVLLGPRLRLEPLLATHAPALYPLLAADELWRFTADRAPASLTELRARYRRLETRANADGSEDWLNWALMLGAGSCVGFVQATIVKAQRHAELAYVIGEAFQMRGFGSEAVRVVLSFLEAELQVADVSATVDERNGASLRLLQKAGFACSDDRDRRNLRFELRLTPR